MRVRTLGLVSCVAVIAGLPIPMWTATQAALSQPARRTAPWFTAAAIVVAYLFAAILPVFFFTLYRNPARPRLSKGLRWGCLAGAAAGAVEMVSLLPEWMDPSRPGLTTLRMALSAVATLSCIALLIAMFRETGGVAGDVSKPLRTATRIATIAGAVWFVVNTAGLAAAAFTDSTRVAGSVRTLLEQICLFTAPFVLYRSTRNEQ